jgi:hypothetical protein
MTSKAINSALAAAQVLFLPIDGKPSDDNLVCLSNIISPILLKATYAHVNGIHNLWGLVASAYRYLHHYGTPFVRPATHFWCAMTWQSAQKLLASTAFVPKLPGLP